jgi:hypothetical protein
MSNYYKLEINISNEPKSLDGGIIVSNYGEVLTELYIDQYNLNHQTEPFYVKINDNINTSFNNKISFENGFLIKELSEFPLVYNINKYATLIAVYKTKQKLQHEYLVYN